MDHSEPASLEARLRDAGISAVVGVGGFLTIGIWFAVLLAAISAEPSDGDLQIINTLSLGLGTATAAVLYLSWSDRGWEFIDLRTPRLRDVGYAVGGLVALFLVQILVSVPLQYFGVEGSEHTTLLAAREGDPGFLLLLIPLALLVIGPGEELLFRNVVQKRLYDTFSTWGAILVASVIFAIVHFSAYSTGTPLEMVSSLVVVLVLAIVLGWVYARTENLVVPALVHGAYNAVVFGSVYIQVAGSPL